jgi:hypothetical protein
MSRHRIADNELIVTVTRDFFSRADASTAGWPRLIIDYGGAALVLEPAHAADVENAELFALGLAQSSLRFASQCRHLLTYAMNDAAAQSDASLGTSLAMRSQIVINEGCPLAITRDQFGNVVILCGGHSSESVEIVTQPSGLRALVELGADMLEQIGYPNEESVNARYQY